MHDGKFIDGSDWQEESIRSLFTECHKKYKDGRIQQTRWPMGDKEVNSIWINHKSLMMLMIPATHRSPGTRVLDVGGGDGMLSVMLAAYGLDCTTMDQMYANQEGLVNRNGEAYVPRLLDFLASRGVRTVAHDIYPRGFPFQDKCFDIVVCSEVIEHLPNSPKPILSEIFRVLAPGGIMILTTPNAVSIGKRLRLLRGLSNEEDIEFFYNMKAYPATTVYRGHNREYTSDEIKYMLATENFLVTKHMTTDYFRPAAGCFSAKMLTMTAVKACARMFSKNTGEFNVVLATKPLIASS